MRLIHDEFAVFIYNPVFTSLISLFVCILPRYVFPKRTKSCQMWKDGCHCCVGPKLPGEAHVNICVFQVFPHLKFGKHLASEEEHFHLYLKL